jgi:biotin-dependent carboxylase-like uncharacterized protein
MNPALTIVAPGLFSTIQDLGRFGYQRFGVPVSGALDPLSLYAANLLVGNAPHHAALEILRHGPHMLVEADRVRLAYVGGEARIEVVTGRTAKRMLGWGESFSLERDDSLRIGALSGSSTGYLAVEGGFAIDEWLGSQSTYTRAAVGGFEGRRIAAGDRLELCLNEVSRHGEQRFENLDLQPPPKFRVVLGPQDDYFAKAGIDMFLSATFTVSAASDRMGMRLDGPALEHAKGFDIVSDATAPGSIQVPGNGLPIVLLADRQTTGGYPKIATLISADLPAFGRLSPGASLSFTAVSVETARMLRRQYEQEVAGLVQKIKLKSDAVIAIDPTKLLNSNLVSGVIDAREE